MALTDTFLEFLGKEGSPHREPFATLLNAMEAAHAEFLYMIVVEITLLKDAGDDDTYLRDLYQSAFESVLKDRLEDMPLYVNHNILVVRKIAHWRLNHGL